MERKGVAATSSEAKKAASCPFPDTAELPIRGTVSSIKEAIQTHRRSQPGALDGKEGSTSTSQGSATSLLSPEQKAAQQAKDCGNEYFRANKIEDAIHAYTRGIEADPYGATAAILYNNRAMCHLKLQHWADAEADATACLQLDRALVKAYYRRAMARKNLGKLKDARLDLESVLALSPSDATALAEMQVLTGMMQSVRAAGSAKAATKHKVVIEEVDEEEEDDTVDANANVNAEEKSNADAANASVQSGTEDAADTNRVPDLPDNAQRESRIRDELRELERARKEADAARWRAAAAQEEKMKGRWRQNNRVTIVEEGGDDDDSHCTRTNDKPNAHKHDHSANDSAPCADAEPTLAGSASHHILPGDGLSSASTNGHDAGQSGDGGREERVHQDVNAPVNGQPAAPATTGTRAKTTTPQAAVPMCATRVRSKPAKESLVAPKSFTDLERQLAALDKYPDLQQHYVRLINPASMRTLMGSNLTPEVLIAILSAVKHFAGPEALTFVKSLCMVQRIEDIAMFFSAQERQLVQEVLSLVQAGGVPSAEMTQLKRKLGAL